MGSRFKIRYVTILLLIAVNSYRGNCQAISARPVIVITDLYHPYQDPGDNLDLIMGFALSEIDLKAIILDITDAFRNKIANHPTLWKDPRGPREAGIIPVLQLNYIFNRQVPYAVGPLSPMRSEDDLMQDVSSFEQEGINLFLNTLRNSDTAVEIMSFGSARILAVAYNRDPELCRRKIAKIHLSAGTASPGFKLGNDKGANVIPGGEWNVALDVHAFTRILKSDLPIALYPCAGSDGGLIKDIHNTYWQLPALDFLKQADPHLQRYIDYAFTRELRNDFLKSMDITDEAFELHMNKYPQPFHFWETSLWMNVAGRKLVQRSSGDYALIPKTEIKAGDRIIKSELVPCKLNIRDDGRFTFKETEGPSHVAIYYRSDPVLNEKALQQAYPRLFLTFSTKRGN